MLVNLNQRKIKEIVRNSKYKYLIIVFCLSLSTVSVFSQSSEQFNEKYIIVKGQKFRDFNKNGKLDTYEDYRKSNGKRAEDLLLKMTIEEKEGQLRQYFLLSSSNKVTKRLQRKLSNGEIGSFIFISNADTYNSIQRVAFEESRLGIPILSAFDVVHGFRTIFPVPIAQVASWDPEIVSKSQAIAAKEASSVGIDWTFAPMIDITRDPRWGRIVEGVGEDPYLGSAMAVAQVEGFQGDNVANSGNLMAGAKHFVGYGASLGGRDNEEVNLSENELRNVYLPPFNAAVEAGVCNVMSAYMAYNGVPASANKWLLTDLLRDEMKFDGFVVSDNGCVKNLVIQKYAKNDVDAAVKALNAGVDMSMGLYIGMNAYESISDAYEQGLIDDEVLNQAVRRVLEAKFKKGLFENPYVDEEKAEKILSDPKHREIARVAAERSAVLLQNSERLLPLSKDSISSVAVIGPLADAPREILGPWSFEYDLNESITILDGIRKKVGNGILVDFAWGPVITERLFPSPFALIAGESDKPDLELDKKSAIQRAVNVAENADVVILVVGERQDMIGESASRSSLTLPGDQEELIKAVAATGKPIVLLLMSSRPLDLSKVMDEVDAILNIWYPGSQGGAAVANLLFGDVSPGGKLPFTWVRSAEQIPNYYAQLTSQSPKDANKRYWNEENSPLFPFGYGLSYSTFRYDNLAVDKSVMEIGGTLTVSVDLTNTGEYYADEVAQLYIHQRYGTASRPQRELKGFKRVSLASGETKRIEFKLGPNEFKYWNSIVRDWIVEPTMIDIAVGGDSDAKFGTVVELVE